MDQLNPEQQQAVMMQAQQEANQRIMQSMMTSMTENCFKLCAGTSVSLPTNSGSFSRNDAYL